MKGPGPSVGVLRRLWVLCFADITDRELQWILLMFTVHHYCIQEGFSRAGKVAQWYNTFLRYMHVTLSSIPNITDMHTHTHTVELHRAEQVPQ